MAGLLLDLNLDWSKKMTSFFQNCLAENLYFAACSGDAACVRALLERNQFPSEVRDLAHDIAAAGGHVEVAQTIKPTVH